MLMEIGSSGGGQTRHSWGRSGPELAKQGFACIMVDLKGHGDSYWDRVTTGVFPYSSFQVGQDIDRLISCMGVQNRAPVLVGASLGGLGIISSQAGQSFAGGVILVDVTPKLEPTGVDRVMGFMGSHIKEGFATLQDAANVIAEYTSHRVRRQGASESALKQSDNSLEGLKKNLRFNNEKQRWFFHYDPEFVNTGSYEMKDLVYLEELLTECAREIESPVLLVRGKLTDIVSEEGVSRLRKAIPHCDFVDVEQAGHMMYVCYCSFPHQIHFYHSKKITL
jgi:pimeloyl-ACP methyl ester carboxylesterase